jgi:hypothetical protein
VTVIKDAAISGIYRPTVFIGSSQKHLSIAKAVGNCFRKYGAKVTVWDEQVFVENKSYLDILLQTFVQFDFSIFIWARDDVTKSKGSVSASTRDNVVLESGLALGVMGRQHVFIVVEKDVKIPSDFSGIAFADHDGSLAAKEPDKAVKSACNAIRRRVFVEESPALSGNWKCTYRLSVDPNHPQVIEDVRVVGARRGVLIVCESSPLGDPYSAFGRLTDGNGNTIVGHWQNTRAAGTNRGSFILTFDPRGRFMYGYATSLTNMNSMIFSAWLLARSDKADEAEIKRRFSYAEQALRPQF